MMQWRRILEKGRKEGTTVRRKMMGLFMAVTLGIAQMAIPVLADETEEILLLEEAEAEEEFALEEEEGVVGLGIDLEEVIEESGKAEIPAEEISEAEIVLGDTDALEAENVDDGPDAEEAVETEISAVEATDDEVVMEIEIIEEEELPLFDATSESVSEGTCGENLTWTLDADKTLTITGSGPMADFDRSPWLGTFNNPKVEKVILDDNITTIGDLAFLMCGFETIDLPSQLESIGVSAFTQCRKLTSITLPDGVKTVDDGAFSGCISLTSITIPASVRKIGERVFANCSPSLVIYGYQNSTAHQYAVVNDITFVTLDQPAGTEEEINWKLENGSLIISGNGRIPNYASVEETPWAEAIATGEVSAIVISDGITKVGDYAFTGCTAETVTLPDSLMAIGKYAFSNCSNLTEVTIPGNVGMIGENAFDSCGALQTVTITSGSTVVGANAFASCSGVLTIYCQVGSAASTYHNKNVSFRYLYPSSGSCGEDLVWTLEEDGTLTITGSGDMMDSFSNGNIAYGTLIPWYNVASSIKTVIIDEQVTHIGDRAFENCAIESIELPQNLKSIGARAFASTKLTGVSIPEGVTEIQEYAFYPCRNLTKVVIPASVTTIGRNAVVVRSGPVSSKNTIYGKAGSYAQTYAEENNIPFVAVTALGEVTLPETSFVYTGSAIEPEPVVCDEDGNTLVRDTNYTVTYAENTGIGTATVTVTGMDSCTGEAQLTFEIVMPFGDVPTDCEYYNEIADIFMRGLMTGMNETTFEPETTMNRAFMAAVLYRRAGYPAQPFQPIFPDVKEEDWFAECVLWAQASGNMYGYNEGTFGPTDQLNREQLCTILWRYAVTTDGVDNSAKANLEDYSDSKRVSDFAKDAISWCIATGIFEDRDGRLDAWQPATRAELAVMLSRYLAVAGK